MGQVINELLMRRLFSDGVEVLDIVDEQVDYIKRKKYRKAIRIGDHWRGSYLHVPHAMLFDAWSGSAEFASRRIQWATLRLLRSEIFFRRWERSLAEENIILETGESNLIGSLLEQFTAILTDMCMEYGFTDTQFFLLEEYEKKVRTYKF